MNKNNKLNAPNFKGNNTVLGIDDNQVALAIDRSTAIAEFDINGNFTFINDNFLKIFNYNKSELINIHHSKLVTEKTKNSREYKSFWDDLKNGRFVAGEFSRIDRLGHTVWINGSYNPVLDQHGRVCKIIKFALDITDQKQSSIFLEQQNQAISRSNALLIMDMDGVIEEVNENFCRIFSYEPEELVGNHHKMLLNDTSDLEAYNFFWDELKRGSFQSGEFKRKTRLKKEIWIRGSYNPIFDNDGSPIKVIKFAQDITIEKRIFVEYERQLEAINKSNAVIEFDPQGNIISVNQNFLNILGYTKNELIGNHHSILAITETVESDEYKSFWNDLREGHFKTGEFERLTRTGERVWIRGSYNPIRDEDGKIVKIIKFALDVTEHKRAIEEIHNDKIKLQQQSKLAALGKMAAGVSHEINNPLAIVGMHLSEIEEISQEFDNANSERVKALVTKSNYAIKRIKDIVFNLKSYAKQDKSLKVENLDLKEIVSQTIELSLSTLSSHRIQFDVDVPNKVLPMNKTAMQQVLVNLVSNSKDAFIESGQDDKIISIKTFDYHGKFAISFSDNGPGIKVDDPKDLFKPFFTTKEQEGTGLGLSISRKALQSMNALLAYKEISVGCCFVIVFNYYNEKEYAIAI